jgi:hypothetical protein
MCVCVSVFQIGYGSGFGFNSMKTISTNIFSDFIQIQTKTIFYLKNLSIWIGLDGCPSNCHLSTRHFNTHCLANLSLDIACRSLKDPYF